MRTLRTFLLVVLAALPALAPAQNKGGNAKELMASFVRLPSGAIGTLDVQACETCSTRSYRVTEKTLYEIGDESVSMAEVRRQFAVNPNQPLLLELSLDGTEVRRIWLPRLSY